MGEDLYNSSEIAKRVFYDGSKVTGIDLADACFGSSTSSLESTRVAQAAIGAVCLGTLLDLYDKGFKPSAGKGHSAGEVTLLGGAGILSVSETFGLIKARSEITHQASIERPGKMAVVRHLSKDQIASAIADILAEGRTFIINFNSTSQNVLSGDEETLIRAREVLKNKIAGAKFSILKISGAFHSPYHMGPAVEPFYEAAQHLSYREPNFPVMLNNTRYLHELGTDNLAAYLSGQLVSSVDFVGGVGRLYRDGITDFVDVGPKPILGHLVQEDYGDRVRIYTAKELTDIYDLNSSLANSLQKD
ncbi:hypothetical protein A3A68_00680 [Candidatus Saccharibacteria bacterium RIFCSPLOWO2_01_FULL_48_13]|nr:MAG: hypothetical protein A2884_00650 [Candidatus Saccharibacteria bacterium RIFCSPHIGHO2_01_FULL_48_12]OGL35342.1 MAG: hypothetical protein A3F38_01830 [Candidatus Saccharibacteria bacterium RIFCSPHIGHO2_12_FULL_48_21]OGL37575.1 MAG: hypothetical protein A3A68_00680 [Candidatus Saccharibacteria bacterium RIFCSPLOWO2_01_FULL_48_13]